MTADRRSVAAVPEGSTGDRDADRPVPQHPHATASEQPHPQAAATGRAGAATCHPQHPQAATGCADGVTLGDPQHPHVAAGGADGAAAGDRQRPQPQHPHGDRPAAQRVTRGRRLCGRPCPVAAGRCRRAAEVPAPGAGGLRPLARALLAAAAEVHAARAATGNLGTADRSAVSADAGPEGGRMPDRAVVSTVVSPVVSGGVSAASHRRPGVNT